ncbi:hypothetical protein PVAP13_5KG546607 [Panicum virgatum]|uniref:Uncharacterized protein n=1 Tax=Panicum virgatum TaxID=38727 RepID=A0A8T0SMB2_PANVG|nr:hypothetical protein PVAP13_5KG546607 [Panicum virgatum]
MNNLNLQGGGVLRPTHQASKLGEKRRREPAKAVAEPASSAPPAVPFIIIAAPLPYLRSPLCSRWLLLPLSRFPASPSVSDPLITPRVPLSLIRRSAGSLLSRRVDRRRRTPSAAAPRRQNATRSRSRLFLVFP